MGRLMNNYFYGKAGKGDFKKSDLPDNRWQLFLQMLRIRLSNLFRMNLMTCLVFLPLIVVLFYFTLQIITYTTNLSTVASGGAVQQYNEQEEAYETDASSTAYYNSVWGSMKENVEKQQLSPEFVIFSYVTDSFLLNTDAFREGGIWQGFTHSLLLLLIPFILITGPVQAGMAYVNRNWARDEHAFIWSDFMDAVKANWKQSLGISAITAFLPLVAVVAIQYYWGMTFSMGLFMYIPLGLVIILTLCWFLALVYAYPMLVGYKVTFKQLLKNSFILAVGRLPHTVGIRLCMLAPVLLSYLVCRLFPSVTFYALLFDVAYYILFGNAFARFVYASFTNSMFERFINPHIPGAPTRSGLAEQQENDDEDEDTLKEDEKEV